MTARAGRNYCNTCKITFGSIGAFDMHRVGSYGKPIYNAKNAVTGYTPCERRCLTIPEMETQGMTQNEKGWWLANTFTSIEEDVAETAL